MKKSLAVRKVTKKKLGRPPIDKDEANQILSNGLLLRQWKRIKEDCGEKLPTEFLRVIVDWYFAQIDYEKASLLATIESEKKV